MEATPHLHLVDSDGQATAVCEHCVAKDQAIERLTRSYEGTVRNLREQLDDKRAAERELDPVVFDVIDDWCGRAQASGWWSRKPKPSQPRLDAASVALNKGHTPGYLAMVHKGAFWSAQTRKRDDRFQRAWLEPASLYGKMIDAHYETAVDPQNERVRQLMGVPAALMERWPRVMEQADMCGREGCGHIRLDHQKPGVAMVDMPWLDEPCLVHGCTCIGFDDSDLRADQWIREQLRRGNGTAGGVAGGEAEAREGVSGRPDDFSAGPSRPAGAGDGVA